MVDVALPGEKRKQMTKGGFRTKSEAVTALNEVLHAVDRRSFVLPQKLTLGAYLEEWLAGARSTVRLATWDSYRLAIEHRIVPRLGTAPLQALSVERISSLYADLLEGGRRDGQGLAPKTVRNVHVVLRKALADAVRRGYIVRNPAEDARLPKSDRREMRTWTVDELRRFLAFVDDDSLRAAWILSAHSGLRRGELLGLRWRDVDLKAQRASIQQTLVSVGYELHFSTPKTARGRRSVPLNSTTIGALLDHQLRQSDERQALGSRYLDHDLVFAKPDGSPVHPQVFSDMFERLVRRAGLPVIRLHDLRHTFASISLQSGTPPKVISDILGHSTVAFTMDVYSHAIPQMQEETSEAFAELLGGQEVRT